MPFELIIKTLYGLEPVLETELKSLGAKKTRRINRAVVTEGDAEFMYRCNLELHTALSVLKPITSFEAQSEKQLYNGIRSIKWHELFTVDQTFAIESSTFSKVFTHSQYAGLKSKDAIADYFRYRIGSRPSVDPKNPDILINVHIVNTTVSVSLNSSGISLDRRGYRLSKTEAPINEVLAAGMLKLMGFDGSTPFYDPMCGSGTQVIEAAFIAGNIAPGKHRSFSFQKWKDFDSETWNKILKQAIDQEVKPNHPVLGSDNNDSAIAISKKNAERAGVSGITHFEILDFFKSKKMKSGGMLLLNPPYGERLKHDEINRLYQDMGSQFKHHFPGWTAAVISSDFKALKRIGLRPFKSEKLFNGPLECRFNAYELFEGKNS